MAEVANWVVERSVTIGDGDITLAGSLAGFSRFRDALPVGLVWYSIEDGDDREAGIATFDGVAGLVRTDVRATLVGGVFDGSSPDPITLTGNALVACTFNESAFVDFSDDPNIQVNNVVILGTLDVTGLTTLDVITFTTLAGGEASLGNTDVDGTLDVTGAFSADSIIAGAIVGSSLDIGGAGITVGAIISVGNGDVTGNWTVSGLISSATLNVTGLANLGSLDVANNATIHGNLIVDGIFSGGDTPGSGFLILDPVVKTASFVAVAGNAYLLDSTAGSFIVTLPGSPIEASARVGYIDYGRKFSDNPVSFTSGEKIEGDDSDYNLNLQGSSGVMRYIDVTKGWLDTGGLA